MCYIMVWYQLPAPPQPLGFAQAEQSGFPTTSMLDNFNRANGAIGSSWTGQNDSSFTISSNQLAINSSGLDSFAAWSPASFGADQEAYVTLTQLSASGLEQGLLLKTAADASAALKVVYVASANVVRVFTFTSAQGWAQRGLDISVTFNNGDQFGARAKSSGDVEVYRNGSLLGTVSVTAWTPYSGGGYIGLWYANTSGAIVDDFGGGNVSASATPTNTSTPTNTNTSTITRTPTVTTSPAGTMTPSRTLTPANTLTPSLTPTIMLAPSITPTLTNTPTFTQAFTSTPTSTPPPSGPVIINYDYDPLYRLTEANYSNGDQYHYTYDAVGNRTEQQTLIGSVPLTTSYVYDAANRLTSVDSVPYTWDNNGNLLNDGVNTYAYDSANRLISVSNQSTVSSYQYNGLGDRLTQSAAGGNTINYTLDLNTGLTQILNDGTNTYLYGMGRIAQVNTTTEYFLGDALGSVRQLTDASGEITLAKSYQPYGEMLSSFGSSASPFAFTGEQQDASGLTYLRARYYSSGDGRFLTRDTWMGNESAPMSFNRWNYTQSNPINYTDPTGLNPNCKVPFRAQPSYCADQRFIEIVSKDPWTAGKNALTLVALFEDQELQTLWGNVAGRTVSERLEWLLELTRGSADGDVVNIATQELRLPLQFRYDSLFGDNDCWFKEELRDNQFYGTNWTKTSKHSNQVGHFLTAVALGYSYSNYSIEQLVIGHELISDNSRDIPGGLASQLNPSIVADRMRQDFWDAVDADARRNKLERDELLWSILGFQGSVNPNYVDPNREGNSLQDFRLTARGVRFGQWIKDNPNLQPIAGARWLRQNILFGISKRTR